MGRAGAIVAAILAVAVPGLASARSVPRFSELDLTASGGVVVTWHGDPARGCAAAGLCGYSGSATLDADGSDGIFFFGGSPGGVDFQPQAPVVVRVRRAPAAGEPGGTCVDVVPAIDLGLAAVPAGRGKIQLVLGTPGSPFGVSSGRCAGPIPTDITAGLRSAVLDVRALERGSGSVDLTGRTPISLGPFSGELSSTLRLRFRHLNEGSGQDVPQPRPPPLRPVKFLKVALTFRIAPAAGALTTTFSGSADPFCRALDSCGATGQVSYAFPTRGGRVGLTLVTPLRGRAPAGLPAALALVRRGRTYAYGDGQLTPARGITTTERLTQGPRSCSDSQPSKLAPFDVTVDGRRVVFDLGAPGYESLENLRTRCPGPTEQDAFPRRTLAETTLPLAAMLEPRPRAVLRSGGPFSGEGYTGSSGGGVVLDMHRVRARVRTITVRVPAGELP